MRRVRWRVSGERQPSRRSVLIPRILVRYLLVWVVNAASLILATMLLPGIWFDTAVPGWWRAAVLLPVEFSLLILIVRPVLVLATLPLNVATLGLPTLLFNGVLLYLSAKFEPAFHIDGLDDAFGGMLLFTVANTMMTSRLGIDEVYPFFQTILRNVGTRFGPSRPPDVRRGLVLLQIDGLSWRSLMRAVRRGRMPTFSALTGLGSHRLRRWQSGVPSNTPAVQGALFYGTRAGVPGYRWYDRAADSVRVVSRPEDVRRVEQELAAGAPGLLSGGSCINSLLAGGASKRLMTISAMRDPSGERRAGETADFNLFWLSPWAYSTAVLVTLWDFATALVWHVQSRFDRTKRVIHRSWRQAAARSVTNAFLRETAFFWLEQDVARGVPVIYSNFVGYDEVAHHAGPDADEALATLTAFDRKLQRLRRRLRKAPIEYDLVLLSDHGQSPCVPFRVVAGCTLEDLVSDLAGRTVPVHQLGDSDAAYVDGLLAEIGGADQPADIRAGWFATRGRMTLEKLSMPARHQTVETPGETQVIVCVSGGLAHLYRRGTQRPLHLEEVRSLYPGLVEGLVSQEGIACVIARYRDGSPIAVGRAGARNLITGKIVGETDPLTPFWDVDHWNTELARLGSEPASGDLIILADRLDRRRVVTFEEQVGTHGGIGGAQTEPFILVPTAWPLVWSDLNSPESLHKLLKKHVQGGLAEPPEAGDFHSDGLHSPEA